MFGLYLVFAVISSFVTWVALNDKNGKAGLYLKEWVVVLTVGAFWPLFLAFLIHDLYSRNRLEKARLENESNKCGCGCGNDAKE